MKSKLVVLVAAVMMFFGGVLHAGDSVSAPYGETSNPINADYGGVDIATSLFNGAISTVPSEVGNRGISYAAFYRSTTTENITSRWKIYGVNFSTGQCGDTVSVFTSTGGFNTNPNLTKNEILRFTNNAGSTVSVAGAGNLTACSGPQMLTWPARAYNNLFWSVSNNGYQAVQLFYWKEKD